ncbi:hypothetical protein R1sor_024857 [Riccia sorocarpa]|uniref:Endonuclease/exonuclease/phosphatase domain-containing protein n=1 Tax=Riccia sorocarpa TaxID=122646 RepID=A0ABD3GTK5_9MARC
MDYRHQYGDFSQNHQKPTALLKGGLLETWRNLDQHWDFADLYHLATRREGPRFTRQVTRGGRLDQARLDRIYASRRGEWIIATLRVKHDGGETASDHIPVLADLKITANKSRRTRRTSFLKLDVDTFRKPGRKEAIRSAWNEGWCLSPDPITAWDLAWGRVRETFKTFRKEDKEQLSTLKQEQNKLEELRIQIAEDPGNANKEEYRKMEQEVKEKEMTEKRILRRRSRVVKEEREVLKTIEEFYGELYKQPPPNEGAEEERDEVLETIDRTVSQEDNGFLTKEPDKKEIQETIDSMASGKSPGEDGVTIEVLKEVWEFVEEACEKLSRRYGAPRGSECSTR